MSTRNKVDTPDFDSLPPSDISGEPGTVYVADTPEIDIIPGVSSGVKGKGGLSKHAQELLFNEEMVEVMVHESTDDNAENPVFTACNGVTQYFYRGVPQMVRRKYVAILASVKEHNVTTPEYTGNDGARAVGIRRTSSLKYPFSVISDKNKNGAEWLKGLLRSQT